VKVVSHNRSVTHSSDFTSEYSKK